MQDVLCIYYSRSGKTKEAMNEIAEALVAELAEISDGVDRSGRLGYIRAGMEAMRRSTHPLRPIHTQRPLHEYRLVIVGTPVWAGRCAAPVRGFLKRRGLELSRVAYVLTRACEKRYEEIYDQMDRYTAEKHVIGGTLRVGSVGYPFWRDKFIQEAQRYLEEQRGQVNA